MDRAKELANYLSSSGVQVVALVTSKDQALAYSNQQIDFLVIVGYLKIKQNYEVIEEYRKRKIPFTAVHWAMLDSLITYYCNLYKIPLRFDRTLPMSDFLSFLVQHRPVHTASLIDKQNKQLMNHAPIERHQGVIIKLISKFQHSLTSQ